MKLYIILLAILPVVLGTPWEDASTASKTKTTRNIKTSFEVINTRVCIYSDSKRDIML